MLHSLWRSCASSFRKKKKKRTFYCRKKGKTRAALWSWDKIIIIPYACHSVLSFGILANVYAEHDGFKCQVFICTNSLCPLPPVHTRLHSRVRTSGSNDFMPGRNPVTPEPVRQAETAIMRDGESPQWRYPSLQSLRLKLIFFVQMITSLHGLLP